jgi:hypothetical protein
VYSARDTKEERKSDMCVHAERRECNADVKQFGMCELLRWGRKQARSLDAFDYE